jgi:DNA-binding response OmpR family regulator
MARAGASNNGPSAFSFAVEGREEAVVLTVTLRERILLSLLATDAGQFVSMTQLLNLGYGIFEPHPSMGMLRADMDALREKFTAALGWDPLVHSDALGYKLLGVRAFSMPSD